MTQRARDFRPVGKEVHAELLDWQRTVSIGEEKRRLDPSLQNPGHPDHIWNASPREFVMGTRVPYSVYHKAYRLEQGLGSHMDIPRHTMRRIAEKLTRYIVDGSTF